MEVEAGGDCTKNSSMIRAFEAAPLVPFASFGEARDQRRLWDHPCAKNEKSRNFVVLFRLIVAISERSWALSVTSPQAHLARPKEQVWCFEGSEQSDFGILWDTLKPDFSMLQGSVECEPAFWVTFFFLYLTWKLPELAIYIFGCHFGIKAPFSQPCKWNNRLMWRTLALLVPCLANDCHETYETASSFLQHGQHLHRSHRSLRFGRGFSAFPQDWWDPVACALTPWMCTEPFDCINASGQLRSRQKYEGQIASSTGQDLHSWCYSDPSYWNTAVLQCLVKKDLPAYAQTMYQYAIQRHPVDEIDASYCFYMGHCQNDQVTFNTTLPEAQVMCDERYPEPNGWRSKGFPPELDHEFTAADAKAYAQAACAMGNFHCDVIYCRETYCQIEHYQKMFQELASKWSGIWRRLLNLLKARIVVDENKQQTSRERTKSDTTCQKAWIQQVVCLHRMTPKTSIRLKTSIHFCSEVLDISRHRFPSCVSGCHTSCFFFFLDKWTAAGCHCGHCVLQHWRAGCAKQLLRAFPSWEHGCPTGVTYGFDLRGMEVHSKYSTPVETQEKPQKHLNTSKTRTLKCWVTA